MTATLDLFDYAQRNAILAAHEQAQPSFVEKAREFVLAYLREHGPTSSELLTDVCLAAGIAPENTKAFGAVYASLSRRGLIVSCGLAPRIRGHGSIGAHIWTLTQPEI